VSWGAVDDSSYAGGTFVFQNNSGNEGNWTTVPWSVAGIDSTFKGLPEHLAETDRAAAPSRRRGAVRSIRRP